MSNFIRLYLQYVLFCTR